MTKNKKIKIMSSHANAFFQVAAELDNGTLEIRAPYVYIVNIIFSIELYLKALIIKSNKSPYKTHELKKLYNQLTEKQKKSLENEYKKELDENSFAFYLKKDLPTMKYFCEYYDNAFIDYRYVFEHYNDEKIKDMYIDSFGLVKRILEKELKK